MMSVWGDHPTKRAFKNNAIGRRASTVIQETSVFGPELRDHGTFPIVGPAPDKRKWYASVTVKNGIIVKVT